MSVPAAPTDSRLLVLQLTARDGATTQRLLRSSNIETFVCPEFETLRVELKRGAAVIAIAEERMTAEQIARLAIDLREQPKWSDLPVLLITPQGADSAAAGDAVRKLGNVTLLERPLRITTLVSAVRTAVRARNRQYQIRGYLEERDRAAEALRVADQRKDEFLATLGHELRNPLAPLLTGLHLLRAADGHDPTIARMTSIMERQVTHLVRLVDDLLEVSRITRGVIDVQHEPVDLATVLRTAVDTTRPAFESAQHILTVELPSEPIAVSGDAVRLTQVFANLLTNAAKYTNSGGRVRLKARRVGARAVISVKDNGIGIPVTHLDSVFEMFMQVDRSNRRAQGGLGIGLTLVRSLVAMHEGSVEARSNGPDTGSEFIVTLPVLAAQPADSLPHALEPLTLPPMRILVVDDNHDAADTLGTLLTTLGATVEVAHSGQAALHALEHFDADAVLLDIGMPELDGYEVARRIRATPAHAHTLLIALTGWGQDQDYALSRMAGFDHHLVKPPDIAELRDALTDRRFERRTSAGVVFARPHH
jgi:signal transduction histidine kinase/ActR/RegA family two-component response regulator